MIYNHLQPFTTNYNIIYNHLQSFTTNYNRSTILEWLLQSFTIIHNQLQDDLQSFTIISIQLQ
jgi:hypothetical protein